MSLTIEKREEREERRIQSYETVGMISKKLKKKNLFFKF